ncbi:MAG: aminotransferase class V-fold PLP-dependent enzyme [Verrucomicrobiota bacterium]|nr:aminotransferase class V-fold PLP-dependent enzyme [Limisphaera sp.]MDW8382890.1 aminotransferase class V-fold PLP-dependent enzyme [Verrucomicrobiota bacterium]
MHAAYFSPDPTVDSLDQRHGGPDFWALDPGIPFLNHGAFGSCPHPVLSQQHALQDYMERQPIRFFVDEFQALWDHARSELAHFLGANLVRIVFLRNATESANVLLRAFNWQPGDDGIVTNHAYNACRNGLERVAQGHGAHVRLIPIPFPMDEPKTVVHAVLSQVMHRTRLALLDHVTSPTGLILPIETLIPALKQLGIETIVDGAHAPSLLPRCLNAPDCLGYAGNCHKWLCAPKSAAFLYVRSDFVTRFPPLITSHDANSTRTDRSRFLLEFGWMGTMDPTPWVECPSRRAARERASPRRMDCHPTQEPNPGSGRPKPAVRTLRSLNACARFYTGSYGRRTLATCLLHGIPTHSERPGSPAQLSLTPTPHRGAVFPWPRPPARLLRISAHLYNARSDYEKLAEAPANWRKSLRKS